MERKKIEFITFNDGYLEILGQRYRFGERTVSMRRHYEAKTAGTRIDRLVHIPYTTSLHSDEKVNINGETFKIEQCQPTRTTCPKCTILTLRKYGVKKDV